MWFEINADGIDLKLQINDYQPTNNDNWDSVWCRCDLLLSSSNWLNYRIDGDEVLLACEIDELEKMLTELLDDKLEKIEEIDCIEPDFKFILYPQTDLRDDPKYAYVQPGYEIRDAHLEWKVFFWNGGITDNHLVISLEREEIKSLRDYLSVIRRVM
ncbi:MAG: hypothetical protein SPK49_07600 [Erysipelotrichaceae bacterium]|nr:hypothetical protein [Erysipelotrichaceae bacterium]MDY5728465.1 hypothetical protein [Erysipelotrichaceae bacterium]